MNAVLFSFLLALPAAAQDNLILNPGFEQAAGRAVNGWSIHDKISAVVAEGAHSGKRCLRIVDPDKKTGSSVHSNTIRIERGKQYGLWVWLYLESGDTRGLGVYVDWLDKAGKRMRRESEGSCRRPRMRQGRWTRFFFVENPPAGAASMRVWLHTFSAAVVTCRVDDVVLRAVPRGEFGPAVLWNGGELDDEHHKDWPYGLRWEHGASSAIRRRFDKPQDWTHFTAITFNMYLPHPTESTFVLIASSENPKTKGADYYSVKLRLDWKGWKSFIIPLREMGRAREPLGLNHIDSVTFTAAGWGQTLRPDTVVTLDGFKLSDAKDTGQVLTDEKLFALLDLNRPELKAVKAAVARGDLAAAKHALAQHIRTRTYPRWTIDPRERPSKGVKFPTPDMDRAPDQWDYYSTFIKLDWKGWKHFSFKKSDFKGPAYVEGKGWVGKKPIGWNWIQYILLSARGWGLKPDPKVTLYFDDVKLVGKNKTVVLSDFENGENPAEGLELSSRRVKSGRASGQWSNLPDNTHVKWSNIPHDWTHFDTLEFWLYNETPSQSRIVMVLDSDVPRVMVSAEQALRREWTYSNGPGQPRGTIRFKEKIDWAANPTKGEARTHLWNEALNRHFHFRTLARAYWQTGQDKYAKEIADQIVDWVKSNPPLLLSSGNARACKAWQTLTTGIRLADTWPEALYRCLDSPAFTDDVICTILKSVYQQAEHLVRWPSRGNWLTAESNGLYTAGLLFPEFKRAKDWRRIAIDRIYNQLDDEVYPDGMEYELATGYNNWVVREFTHILELAQLNHLENELPKDYLDKIEKCYNYQFYSSMPNGCMPGLNDSGPSNIRKSLRKAYELFPRRKDFLYVATSGAQGEEPKFKSIAFPWCGHYVMRSGWDADAVYLLFDSGPFGFGHQHEDKLHFVLFAYGRSLLLDPGNFSYDRSRWRRYVISTRGHNTVLVDGQGQHRRGLRDTYFWPRPWKGAAPKQNDTRWISTPQYDFVDGTYRCGYGPRRVKVVHRRRILWVKPTYFLVVDTLTPPDEKPHTYDALFHLDGENAAVEGLSVRLADADRANVRIAALPQPGLTLRVVKGKKDEPVQGWANSPWRAIPCAIFERKAAGVVRLAFVVAPWPAGAECPVTAVERVAAGPKAIAGLVKLRNGEVHRFVFSDDGAARVEMRSPAGGVTRRIAVEARGNR